MQNTHTNSHLLINTTTITPQTNMFGIQTHRQDILTYARVRVTVT